MKKARLVDRGINEDKIWAVDERELKRWIAFYEKYRSNPEVRLRGEKARRRKRSKKHIRNKRSPGRQARHS
jgi:hypothetical protein